MDDSTFNVLQPVVGALQEQGLVTIRFPFLQGDSQNVNDANPGRAYRLTTERAHLLVSLVVAQLAILEKKHS